MNKPVPIQLLFYINILCGIAMGVVKICTGVRIPFFLLFVISVGTGTLIFVVVKGFYDTICEDLNPARPKLAEEHRSLQSLMTLADSRGGSYEVVGRVGKATISDLGNEYTVTGRATAIGFVLAVSAQLKDAGFRLEMSKDPIRRADVQKLITDNAAFDSIFSLGATDALAARNAVLPHCEQLIQFGKKTAISTARANLELKRHVNAIDDSNTAETLQVFASIYSAI